MAAQAATGLEFARLPINRENCHMDAEAGDLSAGKRIERLEGRVNALWNVQSELKVQADRWKWLLAVIAALGGSIPLSTYVLGVLKEGPPGNPGDDGISIPLGSIVAWPGALPEGTQPWSNEDGSEWHLCDGSALDKDDYGELLTALGGAPGEAEMGGSPYGWNGPSKFKLPDFQGAFLRGMGGNSLELGEEQPHATALPDPEHPFKSRTVNRVRAKVIWKSGRCHGPMQRHSNCNVHKC